MIEQMNALIETLKSRGLSQQEAEKKVIELLSNLDQKISRLENNTPLDLILKFEKESKGELIFSKICKI